MDSVGERIKEIRTSKGYTQADLADALDTTTAAISRYEQGKREVRIPQAKAIADFLGVSVPELYGIPSERQAEIERTQETISLIRKQIEHNSEQFPDGSMQGMNESLQIAADSLERKIRDEINLAAIVHKTQVQVAQLTQSEEEAASPAPPKIDLADKRRNKRLDSLVSMFCSYPDDAQSRILDAVSTLGGLNSAGQKRAIGRIKELAELPRYQARKENDTEA